MRWKPNQIFRMRFLDILLLLHSFLVAHCITSEVHRRIPEITSYHAMDYPPVKLHLSENHVVLANGILNVTLSMPSGMVTGIQYNGIDNLLANHNAENDRGYWDVFWSNKDHPASNIDKFDGASLHVIMEKDDQVELSFIRTWNSSHSAGLPLNIDKRYIMLRGHSGFYSYAIVERLKSWPGVSIFQGRIVFKLQQDLFQYMALSDSRQRIMPTAQDRAKGVPLAYPEAVLLTNSNNSLVRGEVDDKYQYSSDNKDVRVHGWISSNPPSGFWMITPSNEFKTAGPTKQDLTSHVGPTVLSMFFSTHYAGMPLAVEFCDGEPWKKVFGPVFIYLNSALGNEDPRNLWKDAKKQMHKETKSWPYNFPISSDFHKAEQRGSVTGRLLVYDRCISKNFINANSSYIGLAPPGDIGSWQRENKGYQFWTQTDANGKFIINNIRQGRYNLYAWVPGFIGDYKFDKDVEVLPGSNIKLGNLVYKPPRNGPTLWEIGIPDRTAAEFFVPDPNPKFLNRLYVNQTENKFRQYGLWDRYSEIYPKQDLVYRVGSSNFQRDWHFAQVNRNIGNNTYIPTTWKIMFNLTNVNKFTNYTLRLALASANNAQLQVRINSEAAQVPHFTTGLIGNDNAIARHGIHGLYWLYSIGIPGRLLVNNTNIIFLTQSKGSSRWIEIMYDYIRLEGSK